MYNIQPTTKTDISTYLIERPTPCNPLIWRSRVMQLQQVPPQTPNSAPETRQSSIQIAVRVRPFTDAEQAHLVHEEDGNMVYLRDTVLSVPSSAPSISMDDKGSSLRTPSKFRPMGIRRIIDCVDDKMLIFDPSKSNPLNELNDNVMHGGSNENRRRLRRFGEQKFIFDKIFDTDVTQQEVYQNTTRPLLDSVLDGYNGTVFAYGATGCGKTYTISGTSEQPGIIFLTMQELFVRMEQLRDTKKFELQLSFLEIYNEQIHDLLDPDIPSQKLVIREDSESKTFVSNLSKHSPQNVEEVMDLVIKGNMNRTTSPTDANETSSRSHAVLQIHVTQMNRTADIKQDQTFATLSIIDLAGSERAAVTKNRGERLIEGANINRSLLALGNCINALCVSSTRAGLSCHVPYRDSKLTRLLKFSLGGNCKTVMIVCISPSSKHYDETLNTLKYANRAKEIKTKVIRNKQSLDRHVGSYLKLITEQKREIEELRQREQKMIEIQLTQFKNGRDKVDLQIKESIRELRMHLYNSEKIQEVKLIKSLILVKRHYLMLVHCELENVLHYLATVNITEAYGLVDKIHLIQDQIMMKMTELEHQFDEPSDIETSLEYMRETHLKKIRECDHWQELNDIDQYDMLVSCLAESVRNEILINGTRLIERVVEDPILRSHFQIISKSIVDGKPNTRENKNNDIVVDTEDPAIISYYSVLRTIEHELDKLNNLDTEFDQLAQKISIVGQRKRSSPIQKQQPAWRKKLIKQVSGQVTPIRTSSSMTFTEKGNISGIGSSVIEWNEPQDVSMMLDDTDPVPTEQSTNKNTTPVRMSMLQSLRKPKPKLSLTATQLK
ncbi:hypothetical protein FIM1_2378 [Kluyveromyces marxianus]|uniref:Kinesin-like protein n=1 Tax=Kluyveromyces marxianus TaxID=4911 RepID=A0ABX6EVX5_KLUMA|nr:hypothetical protein FIM1_2378 [Kluyveromyces marxianus]